MVATAYSAYCIVNAQIPTHQSLMLIKTLGSKAGYNKDVLACKNLSMLSMAWDIWALCGYIMLAAWES